jgi:hypothetical protein
MSTNTPTADLTALAATLAPEDLRCGDDVAVLNEVCESPSWLWCELATATEQPVRVKYCAEGAGMPMKVKAICLPFVFTKAADGQLLTLDVRQRQLVRLDRRYAQTVWKALRKQRRSGRSNR